MRGRGSSAERLEVGKEEVDWRGGTSEEGAAALAVSLGRGMEGEGGHKGATLHLAPGSDAPAWIGAASQGGKGLLACI